MNQSTSVPFSMQSGFAGNHVNRTGQEVFNNDCDEVNSSIDSFQNETPKNVQQHDDKVYIQKSMDYDLNDTGGVDSKMLQTDQHSSLFMQSSESDIELHNLEELLAETSICDFYLGPVKNNHGKMIPLDVKRRTIGTNSLVSMPYSSTPAFSPGIQVITEMWTVFLRDRLSHCNVRIHNMSLDNLRTCLHDHSLNQLGNATVLKRRLQEFVRRARVAQSIDHNTEIQINDDDVDNNENSGCGYGCHSSSVLGEVNLNSQIINNGENDIHNLKKLPVTMITKLQKPVILTPDTFYDYLLIIDLEATCESKEKIITDVDYPHEIIEFPILLYNTRLRKCVSVFHAYCKPKLHPDLSEFCMDLTQIQQTQVDAAQPFPYVLLQIEEWLFKRHKLTNKRCAIVCDCNADMSKFMRIQCRLTNISMPSWASVWINLTKSFRAFYQFPSRYRITLKVMLRDLGLSFVGQRHRGLDDAVNILRIVRILLSDGCLLRVNERIDFNKPPSFVSSVPRHVAQVTSGLMGSKLILQSPSPRKSKSNGNSCHARTAENKQVDLSDLDDNNRESLLWLANIQKTRIHRDN
ncbi:unnamed protein product [Schistosoma turkestanicum]|nr:unnamed protein product [Schistosoma turkestanicum]